MRNIILFAISILFILFTSCNPDEIIKLDYGRLSFSLPEAKRKLPTQNDVVRYRIRVESLEEQNPL